MMRFAPFALAATLLAGCATAPADATAPMDAPDAAAAPAPAAATAPLTVDLARLTEHIRLLSSDEFEGRGPAQPGEKKTVDYLIAQMKAAGLQPGGTNGGWTQTVGLNLFKVVEPTASLKVGGWTKPLAQGIDVALRTRLPQSRLTLRDAPVVFVGYGVDAPERGWDDYKGVDLKGKIALVLVNDPDFETEQPGQFDGETMTYYGRWTYKYEELARKGAAGVIVVHETVPVGYGWPTVRNSNTNGVFDIVLDNPGGQRAPLEGWIQRPIAVELFQRAGLDFQTAKDQAKTKAFKPITLPGATFSTDFAVSVERTQSDNVIGRLVGTERPDETVLIGAHWDHLGRGLPDANGDDIYNGALDNASGVGGLLELARTLAPTRPARSIVFASWAVEERGLLGSEFYAQNPVFPLGKTAAVFNMDGLGHHGPARDITIVGAGKSQMDVRATELATAAGLRVSPESNPEVGTFYRSDHFPLAKVGVPALYMSAGQDLVNGGVAAGEAKYKEYIENRYHQPADEFEPAAWDLTGALPELTIIQTMASELANAATWPTWNDGAEFKPARDRTASDRAAR